MTFEPQSLAAWWSALPVFGLCAALLWVGAAMADEAAASAGPGARRAGWIATLLVAAAIWWSAQHGQASESGAGDWALVWIGLAGMATAWAARHGAHAPWHDRDHMLGLGAAALACVVCVSVIHAAPGEGLVTGPAALLGFAIALTAALRTLHWPLRETPSARATSPGSNARRAAAAAAAAALLTALGWRRVDVAAGFSPIVLPMLLLIALGSFGATSLRQLRRRRRQESAQATRPMLTDGLTGLPNRSALEVRLAQALQSGSAKLALLVVNLDGFKPVNTSFGHAVGDQLLKQAGQRIARLLPEADFLARVSSDEFVILQAGYAERGSAERLGGTVIDAIAQPFRIGTREVALSCSIGAALYPAHGEPDKLLARAESATQAAKRAGGARMAMFSSEMDADLTQDFELLRELRLAIERGDLELAFQPKIDAGSGQITAAEALLRWRHATRGDIAPHVFVGVAERFGLVNRLGDWVIDSACRQAQRWIERGLKMRVAINLSAQHLRQPDLVPRIRAALERHGVEPARLTCEITETLAMENTQATQAVLTQLGALGVHLSIDDFGTGYSSLAYLRSLPAREVKIDRSFVADLERSVDARAVVDAVVKLAHALGKRVVAEGVETLRQRRILTELGCDELQGYLFARPMSADDLLQWALDARNNDEEAFRSSLYVQPTAQAKSDIEARHKQPTVH